MALIHKEKKHKKQIVMSSEESGSGYRKTNLISPTSAWILHSTPYFFILVFPTAFYDRSRMTGRYLMPFCKNRFFRFCSHLPLPSTCRLTPSPTSGDGFLVWIIFIFCFFYIKLQILSSLVVSFPRIRREVPSLRGDRGMLAYTGQNHFYGITLLYFSFYIRKRLHDV